MPVLWVIYGWMKRKYGVWELDLISGCVSSIPEGVGGIQTFQKE
jgi:hypothetical protein